MFCRQCGRHIPEGETICPACGYNTENSQVPIFTIEQEEKPAENPEVVLNGEAGAEAAPEKTIQIDPIPAPIVKEKPVEEPKASVKNGKVRGGGFSIAGLIIAILNVLFFWFPFIPVITGLLGIIFSAIGIRSTQRVMGIVSLIINIVFFLITLFVSAFYVYLIIVAINNPGTLDNWIYYLTHLK